MPRKTAEGRREYQRRYYQENKKRLQEAHKKWREENLERAREISAEASRKYRKTVKEFKIKQPDLSAALKDVDVDKL